MNHVIKDGTLMDKSEVKVAQSRPTLCDPGQNTGVGRTQVLQARIVVWVAFPFSRRSSRPRDQIQVSCIAGRFFTTEPPGKPLKISGFL